MRLSIPNEKPSLVEAYRAFLALHRPGIDGIVPTDRTPRQTEALAATIGGEKRRARAAEARELRRRVAAGTASIDELRRMFPQRFADH
jgi:hypothetical protein